MGDLMRVPPSDTRLARTGKSALAGGAIVVVAVIAAYFLIHAVIVFLEIAAAVAVVAFIAWFLLFRRGRGR
jgi:hypothetical protein